MRRYTRALISVSDKTGVAEFARALEQLGLTIASTGGTAGALRDAGVAVVDVAAITGFPEIMDGRVKTLHPAIHGGILGRLDEDEDVMSQHGIGVIDLVAVNLYPFEKTVAREGTTRDDAVENIDIGGPAMIRAAAKNHARVGVIVDPADYPAVLEEIRERGALSVATRRRLARKAFAHTSAYDAAINNYLRESDGDEALPGELPLGLRRQQELRYGENPHQAAALYRMAGRQPGSIVDARTHQGKPLSFNNIADADAAIQCVNSLDVPACVIVKHANPCGVGVASTATKAYQKAFATDPTSAFGGIIAFNCNVSEETAAAILAKQFVEVIVAPGFDQPALAALAAKPNIRVLATGAPTAPRGLALEQVSGGMLVQERDTAVVGPDDLKVVTEREPGEAEISDALFAWSVIRHVKSNAILFARGGATLGVGAGQMSRVMSVRIAAWKAAEAKLDIRGAVMASDAFFPFRDGLDAAAEHGIGVVIQPGGSVRDDEVIAAANEHGMAMLFTGMRHFRH